MLPREVETENWPDRLVLNFPARQLGPLRFVGLLPMGFAVFFAAMPARLLWGQVNQNLHGHPNPMEWVVVGFISLFVLVALAPFCLGLFILIGRTRIVADDRRLTVTEIAGPIRWRRRVKYSAIDKFEVLTGRTLNKTDPQAQRLAGLAFAGALCALKHDGNRIPVLIGYPADWLEGTAGELAVTLSRYGNQVPVSTVAVGTDQPVTPVEAVPQKPADSAATISETGSGTEITVPSRGLWKETGGFFFFGIVWCLFISVFTVAMLSGGFKSGSHPAENPWVLPLVLSLFWFVGLGMTLVGLHFGTRRWKLRVSRQSLRVEQKSALRTRVWEWPRADIADIQVSFSNVTVNNRRLEELRLQLLAGGKKGLLMGRTHAELVWIAATIRRTFGMVTPDPS